VNQLGGRHATRRAQAPPLHEQRFALAVEVQSLSVKSSQREMQPTVGQLVAKQRSPFMQGTTDSP
jgi:hypothetical protein